MKDKPEQWTDEMTKDFHKYVKAFKAYGKGKITVEQMEAALAEWNASAGGRFITGSVKK